MDEMEREKAKEKIIAALNNADKNSENYEQIYTKIMKTITKKNTITMEEVVASCIAFQKTSATEELQKQFFDFLIEPLFKQRNYLCEIMGLDLYSNELKEFDRALKDGCIDLQYGLKSAELKEHILVKIIELNLWDINRYKDKEYHKNLDDLIDKEIYNKLLNFTKEEASKNGYRELIIDEFFSKIHFGKKDEYQAIQPVINFLKKDQQLHGFLKRENLSENEKKAHVSVAITQSKLPMNYNYYVGRSDSYIDINEMIIEKEIIYLIAKEVNLDTAVMFDDVLRGKHEKSVDIMTKIYEKAQSTIVKEYIREYVDASFSKKARLKFYKESIIQKLINENNQEQGNQLKELLSRSSISEEIQKLEPFYVLQDSSESKELFAGSGRLVFGEEKWKKFETIVLWKQEIANESARADINLAKMMKTGLDEIERQRMENGFHSVDSNLANEEHRKQLKPESLADIMLQLKIKYPNWKDPFLEKAKDQLLSQLTTEEKSQFDTIFSRKELVHYYSAIDLETGKEAEKIFNLQFMDTGDSIVEQVKKRLDIKRTNYLLPMKMKKIDGIISGEEIAYEVDHKKFHQLIQTELEKIGIDHTEEQVADLIRKTRTHSDRWKERKKRAIEQKVQKAIEECLNQGSVNDHAKEIRKFETKKIDKKNIIKAAMEKSLIEVHRNRDRRLSIEKQFSEKLYENEAIKHFVRTYPRLKSTIDECVKRSPLVPTNIKVKSHGFFKDSRRLWEPFQEHWWKNGHLKYKDILKTKVDKKNLIKDDLDCRVKELFVKNQNVCAQVVLSLIIDLSGVGINLNPKYAVDYLHKSSNEQKQRRTAQRLVDCYDEFKESMKISIPQKVIQSIEDYSNVLGENQEAGSSISQKTEDNPVKRLKRALKIPITEVEEKQQKIDSPILEKNEDYPVKRSKRALKILITEVEEKQQKIDSPISEKNEDYSVESMNQPLQVLTLKKQESLPKVSVKDRIKQFERLN